MLSMPAIAIARGLVERDALSNVAHGWFSDFEFAFDAIARSIDSARVALPSSTARLTNS